MLATPATTFPENQRNVPYFELLDYAKRISRFTVPPTFRARAPAPQPANAEAVNGETDAAGATDQDGTAAPHVDGGDKRQGIGVSSLEQKEVEWLDPLNQIPFVPWPSEEVIKRGALAQIQGMLEQGIDPAAGVGARADEAVKEMGDIEIKQEDGDIGGVGTARVEVVKGPVSGAGKVERREEKPKVFGGLDLYDPDEEG